MATKKEKTEAKKLINGLESFVPVSRSDIKYAVEIPVKEKINLESVEKVGEKIQEKKKTKKIKTPRKTKKIYNKIENKKPKVQKIKTGGHILIITEKPQAAWKIATALGDYRKLSDNGIPYYELLKNGEKIIVACAVGHLFTLNQKPGQSGFPVFELEWIPSYLKKADFTKKYYLTLSRLCKDAKEFIVATDYDIEGEVIGFNVIRFICEQKDAKRMKFSSLTKDELEQAYNNVNKTLNWGLAISGETRHYLDWLYGINLSRALMAAIKAVGAFKIMSIGRVQGPALALVVDKELEIKKFQSSLYWQVFVNVKGKIGTAETKINRQNIIPPFPFDLTTLQTEAYRFFGINPARTLQIAQNLYLAGIISYPRTSSQKIPETINPKSILRKLAENYKEVKLAIRTKPVEGNKSDPAHPSIYPTGEKGSLRQDEEKIYDLIVRRFISCFCEDAIVENKKISFIVDGLNFFARGMEIKKKAWMEVYKARLKEAELQDLNGEYKVEKVKIEEKQTQPPKRYTPASLISELTKRNLGTKATRAAIIETLYQRGYIQGQSIQATELGISLIKTLKKHSPIIIDEKLTRNFEREIEDIQRSKKDLEKKQQKILNEAKDTIIKITDNLKKDDKEIGKELINANSKAVDIMRKENELMLCPKCKKGRLAINYNKKSRRYFVACNAYPNCKTTFSLPPNGLIKKTDKVCEKCGWPMMMRVSSGKRPWVFCFNPDCKSNEEWQKKKKIKTILDET